MNTTERTDTLLEWLTAGLLVAVLAVLAWMVLVVLKPRWTWLRLGSQEAEVVAAVALLAAALALVSLVALRETRDMNDE